MEANARKISFQDLKLICKAISAHDDLEMLMRHLVEIITRAFSAKGCSILIYDEREKQLFRVASHGVSEEYLLKGPVLMDDEKYETRRKEPVFIRNTLSDQRVQYPVAAEKEGIVSMLSYPIKNRDHFVGLIRLYKEDDLPLHSDDLDAFSILAHHMALEIQINGLKNFAEKVLMATESLPLNMLHGISD